MRVPQKLAKPKLRLHEKIIPLNMTWSIEIEINNIKRNGVTGVIITLILCLETRKQIFTYD